MSDKKTAEKLLQSYRKLASKLVATGPIIQGTITRRTITKKGKKPGESDKSYGPYFQWTFKRAGKTVTVNLTSQQAKLFQKAIDNNRKVEDILSEMRRLSRQICDASAEGVKKRTRKK